MGVKNDSCSTKQYDNVCRDWFQRIEKRTDERHAEMMKWIKQLDKSIRGNGKKGLITRVELLEQANSWVKRVALMVIGAGVFRFIAKVFD